LPGKTHKRQLKNENRASGAALIILLLAKNQSRNANKKVSGTNITSKSIKQSKLVSSLKKETPD